MFFSLLLGLVSPDAVATTCASASPSGEAMVERAPILFHGTVVSRDVPWMLRPENQDFVLGELPRPFWRPALWLTGHEIVVTFEVHETWRGVEHSTIEFSLDVGGCGCGSSVLALPIGSEGIFGAWEAPCHAANGETAISVGEVRARWGEGETGLSPVPRWFL